MGEKVSCDSKILKIVELPLLGLQLPHEQLAHEDPATQIPITAVCITPEIRKIAELNTLQS